MRLEKRLDIKVRGKDLFGASFRENAQLIAVDDCGLCLSMWRPVKENTLVEVQLYDHESYWMWGQIVKVRNHLDGTQTVKVKLQ